MEQGSPSTKIYVPEGICTFAASAMPKDPAYLVAAQRTGNYIGSNGHLFVYGGSRRGLMGASRKAAKDAGGKVVGIILERWKDAATLYDIIVQTFEQRLAKMKELSKGFVCLPGGIGTFWEALDIIQGGKLKDLTKPVAFINTNNFYEGMLTQLEKGIEAGFIPEDNRQLWYVTASPEEAVEFIKYYQPPIIRDKVGAS